MLEIWEKHQAGRDLCYSIFTVPEHRRLAAADYETWSGWKEELIDYLKEKLGFVWGVERADPAGKCWDAEHADIYCECSKCRKWHPHVNLYWVRSTITGHLTDAELLDLKREWARIIGAAFTWQNDGPHPVIDVRHRYCKDPETQTDRNDAAKYAGMRRHWALYLGRHWAAWQQCEQIKRHLRIKWYGKFPTRPLSEEKADKKLRRLYRDLEKAEDAGNFKRAKVIQRSIDRLRKPPACRCGCTKTYLPEPENVCKCCGERRETMRVLDEEEAAYWEEQGPEATLLELRRRRKEQKRLARESAEVTGTVERYKGVALDPPLLFAREAREVVNELA